MSQLHGDLSIELRQVLPMTSQFLLKEHNMVNFLFAFFLKITVTSKTHISGRKQILTNSKKLSSPFLTLFHISQ